MGVIKGIWLLLSHPRLIPIMLGYVKARVRDNYASEKKWLDRLQTYADRMGRGDLIAMRWRARHAELKLRTGDATGARADFLQLLKLTDDAAGSFARHQTLFARYYIAMIDLKPEQADYWARRAAEEGVSRKGVTRIPAPTGNRLAREWDEEIEALNASHGLDRSAVK